MTDLTSEQLARINKKASSFNRYALWILATSWLAFVAAVWWGSWRLAGIGVLLLMPALFCALLAHTLRSPEGRQRIVEKIRQSKT